MVEPPGLRGGKVAPETPAVTVRLAEQVHRGQCAARGDRHRHARCVRARHGPSPSARGAAGVRVARLTGDAEESAGAGRYGGPDEDGGRGSGAQGPALGRQTVQRAGDQHLLAGGEGSVIEEGGGGGELVTWGC